MPAGRGRWRRRPSEPSVAQSKAKADLPEALAAAPVAETEMARDEAVVMAKAASARPMPTPTDAAARMSAQNMPTLMATPQATIAPHDFPMPPVPNRDRFQDFKTNPVRSALDPVSTFSIDVDTASYSFVRRSLKEGVLPQADTVRVEEMVNYFPYDWKGPEQASVPFNTTVSVMPAPWNGLAQLMHVAIKGYDVQPAEQPKANLVFLIDVSGSMDEPVVPVALGFPAGQQAWRRRHHRIHRHLCGGRRNRARADQGVRTRQDPGGHRHADARRLDRRRGRREAYRLARNPSSRTASTG